MNTTEIKKLATTLLNACSNLEEAIAQYSRTKVSEYYEIFGSEEQRNKDLKDAEYLIEACEHTLKCQLRIISMTEGIEA